MPSLPPIVVWHCVYDALLMAGWSLNVRQEGFSWSQYPWTEPQQHWPHLRPYRPTPLCSIWPDMLRGLEFHSLNLQTSNSSIQTPAHLDKIIPLTCFEQHPRYIQTHLVYMWTNYCYTLRNNFCLCHALQLMVLNIILNIIIIIHNTLRCIILKYRSKSLLVTTIL
jgi:hypothetical protein